MPNNQITSLQSLHVQRVKALLGSRGKKIRQSDHEFVVDGIQVIREIFTPSYDLAPTLIHLYVTEVGLSNLNEGVASNLIDTSLIIHVSDAVMNEMTDMQTPQGILALCKYNEGTLYKLKNREPRKIAYFWEIQDPGNSGTVIRTAEAMGFDAVIFSTNSVDVYSPKTVRATVGALWHIPIVESIGLDDLMKFADEGDFQVIALDGNSTLPLMEIAKSEKIILVFGNEARGLPEIPNIAARASIPMTGRSESLNVASAAAIAMFEVGIR